MQIILAGHRLDYEAREAYCVEAVRFGALSGDRNLYAIALEWHGSTCILCYRQPERAIFILNDALSGLNSDTSPLTRSAIYGSLSIAHAKIGDETNARNYVEMARTVMPSRPELDFSYRRIQFNASGLDKYEATMYLHLTKHFPDSDYAQLAHNAFEKSINKHPLNQSSLGQALIKKAEAERALGKMDAFVEDLTKGFRIGTEIGSLRRLSEANDMMEELPSQWRTEKAIQDLQKDISHALVVARR